MTRAGAVLVLAALNLGGPSVVAAVGLQSVQSAQDRHCECLNWMDAYTDQVHCGDGLEYLFKARTGHPKQIIEVMHKARVCTSFYERIDDNVCINIDEGMGDRTDDWSARQWCYVSVKCKSDYQPIVGSWEEGKVVPDLQIVPVVWNPASTHGEMTSPNGKLKMKVCGREDKGKYSDKRLRDMSIFELYRYAEKQGLDMGTLLKKAYPTTREIVWDYAMLFFDQHAPALEAIWDMTPADNVTEEMTQEISRAATASEFNSTAAYKETMLAAKAATIAGVARIKQASTARGASPVVVDSKNGSPPFAVVVGDKAYEVANVARVDKKGTPFTHTTFRCVSHCDAFDIF